jgi:hypothetical protein
MDFVVEPPEIQCEYSLKTTIQNNLEHHHNVECQETLVSCTNHCEEFNQLSKPLKDLEKQRVLCSH